MELEQLQTAITAVQTAKWLCLALAVAAAVLAAALFARYYTRFLAGSRTRATSTKADARAGAGRRTEAQTDTRTAAQTGGRTKRSLFGGSKAQRADTAVAPQTDTPARQGRKAAATTVLQPQQAHTTTVLNSRESGTTVLSATPGDPHTRPADAGPVCWNIQHDVLLAGIDAASLEAFMASALASRTSYG
ncbi:MAG: hypothetical protein LBJ48_01720 [Coriobacteriales bacterium]|nr:hypothetical protein [Coriobacteriales bacterium]